MTAPEQEPTTPPMLVEDPNGPVAAKAIPDLIAGSLEDQQAKAAELERQRIAVGTDPPMPVGADGTEPNAQLSTNDPLGEQQATGEFNMPVTDPRQDVAAGALRTVAAEDQDRDKNDQLLGGA